MLTNDGSNLNLEFLLKNDSGIFSSQFDIVYVLSRDMNFSQADIILDRETIFSMNGAESIQKEVILNIDQYRADIKEGIRFVGVFVDVNNAISEVRENDNVFFYPTPINTLVGNEKVLNTEELKLYPNPVRDKVYLKNYRIDIDRIEIINVMGEMIMVDITEEKVLNKGISIETLPCGLYMVRLYNEEGVAIGSFYKQ
jgi:hypothetical protein